MVDKTDPAGLLASLHAAGKRVFLGDVNLVERYVREFAAKALSNYSEVAEGRMSRGDAIAAAVEACNEGGRIFAGLIPEYAPIAGWHGRGLADALRGIGAKGDSDAAVVAEAFGFLVHRIYEYLGNTEDEKFIGKAVEEDVRSLAQTLIGAKDPEWMLD